jgi:hypothetical protein
MFAVSIALPSSSASDVKSMVTRHFVGEVPPENCCAADDHVSVATPET